VSHRDAGNIGYRIVITDREGADGEAKVSKARHCPTLRWTPPCLIPQRSPAGFHIHLVF
jgi:hypothetical protein